jgi:hypothetical protein
MKSRTNAAYRDALRELFIFYLKLKDNSAVRNAFYQDLASQNMRISNKEILLFVEYVLFPHVLLHPDMENKPDLTKASRYATLIGKALKASISPTEFVQFLRKQAKEQTQAKKKTGRADQSQKQSPVEAPDPSALTELPGVPDHGPRPMPQSSSPAPIAGAPSPLLDEFVGHLWYNSDELARFAAQVKRTAKAEPQIVTVTYHTRPEMQHLVVTAMSRKIDCGPYPFRKWRLKIAEDLNSAFSDLEPDVTTPDNKPT